MERIFSLEFEPRDQFEQRQKKIEQIRALGQDPYPREFRWTDTPAALVERFGAATAADLEANKREILADAKLAAVFGKDKVTMFEMNKFLAQHLK